MLSVDELLFFTCGLLFLFSVAGIGLTLGWALMKEFLSIIRTAPPLQDGGEEGE